MRSFLKRYNETFRIFIVYLSLCLAISTVFSSPLVVQAVVNPNLLTNPSFESNPWSGDTIPASHVILATDIGWNSEDPGNGTTIPAGYIEIWGPGAFGPGRPGTVGGTRVTYPPSDGNFICEINTTEHGNKIWQNVTTKSGSLYLWSLNHRGRIGNAANPDVMQLTLNDTAQKDYIKNTTQFADGRGAWGSYHGYYKADSTTTKFSLESVSAGSGPVQSGTTASQPGEGNLVDNCNFITIADPAEVTITVGDNAPSNSELVDNLQDTFTATPDTAQPAKYNTVGIFSVLMNVYNGDGDLIGQVDSIVNVVPLGSTPTATPNITPTVTPKPTPTTKASPSTTPVPTPTKSPKTGYAGPTGSIFAMIISGGTALGILFSMKKRKRVSQ